MSSFWLTLAACALAVCYLIPNHYLPWLTFHTEVFAAWTMMPVAGAILLQAKTFRSNDLFWLSAICLVSAILQRVIGIVHFNGIVALTVLYIVGVMLLALTGSVWQTLRPRQPELYLGAAFVIAATLSIPIVAMQWLGWSWDTAFLIRAPGGRAVANMAQPNLLADLFLLAVCGLLPLWHRRRQYRLVSVACLVLAALLLVGAALTGSRTGAANVLILASIAFWQAPRHKAMLPGRIQILILCVVFFGALIIAPELQTQLQEMPDGSQIFSAASSQSRLATWSMMSNALLTSPWTGFGWQQILKVNFVFQDGMGMEKGMFGQSHNIFLDLMLWMGIPLGAIVSIILAVLLWRALRYGVTEGRWAACAMVVILAIHALLEYPLQYAYFLLPFALLIGSLQAPQALFPAIPIKRVGVFFSLGLAIVGLLFVQRDYMRIEQAFYALRYEVKGYQTTYPKDEPRVWLLDHMAEHIRISRSDPSIPVSETELAHREMITQVTPGPYIILQLAKTYAYHGNRERATFWLAQLCEKFSLDACNAGKQWWLRPASAAAPALEPWPLTQTPPGQLTDLHVQE